MNNVPFEETKYGFRYGGLEVERLISDKNKGWIMIALKTKKNNLQLYITKTGKMRFYTGNKELFLTDPSHIGEEK